MIAPRQYARSARRYKFAPTPHAPVFYSKNLGAVLIRHDGQVHDVSLADAESTPSMTSEAVVKAEDIQNGECSYRPSMPTGSNAHVRLGIHLSSDYWYSRRYSQA